MGGFAGPQDLVLHRRETFEADLDRQVTRGALGAAGTSRPGSCATGGLPPR